MVYVDCAIDRHRSWYPRWTHLGALQVLHQPWPDGQPCTEAAKDGTEALEARVFFTWLKLLQTIEVNISLVV